jgi:hypothetical protein
MTLTHTFVNGTFNKFLKEKEFCLTDNLIATRHQRYILELILLNQNLRQQIKKMKLYNYYYVYAIIKVK